MSSITVSIRACPSVLLQAQSSLVEQLENAPGLEDVYFPRKYSLPTDYYVFQPPDRELNYTQDVIFAPCQGYEYNCCNNTYGLPQFESVDAATESAAAQTLLLNADGSVLSNEYSRKPTFGLVMNEQCTDAGIPFPECYMARVASTQPLATPACWNRNASMVGDAPCRAPSDGTLIPFCMELAFAQNAYVFECGGVYESDPHCGTFLEVHRSGRPEILSDTHLKAQFTSGYHMTLLSTTYQRHNDRVLCYDLVNEGAHEVSVLLCCIVFCAVSSRWLFGAVGVHADVEDKQTLWFHRAGSVRNPTSCTGVHVRQHALVSVLTRMQFCVCM